MPETLPATSAPNPQPNASTEKTGSIAGAIRFIFQRRRCTSTVRHQTASASRRLTCIMARLDRVRGESPSRIVSIFLFIEALLAAAWPPDVRKVFDLPEDSKFTFGLRPVNGA